MSQGKIKAKSGCSYDIQLLLRRKLCLVKAATMVGGKEKNFKSNTLDWRKMMSGYYNALLSSVSLFAFCCVT